MYVIPHTVPYTKAMHRALHVYLSHAATLSSVLYTYVLSVILQKRVFEELGHGVLENAWKGYNCSLFAYGQTGSGKSYSMVGYGANKGVIARACVHGNCAFLHAPDQE